MSVEKVVELYRQSCNTPSDINEHLPTLYKFAKQCDHVTEFGVRYGVSTLAFLAAQPKKLVSYDIVFSHNLCLLGTGRTDFVFRQNNVLDVEIEETDLLFIDTEHTVEQLTQELNLHGHKVRKFLIFHDTDVCWQYELCLPICNWLEQYPQWQIVHSSQNNFGLMVLENESYVLVPNTSTKTMAN